MKILHIFGTDRDILKIRKVLHSAYLEEQAEEVLRKSAAGSFFSTKTRKSHERMKPAPKLS